jgi:hypothetical protein
MSEKKEVKGLTIHARMAKIKKELSETKIAKSGHNKFAGFKYHELSDFIEIVNKLNEKHGVNDVINIDKISGSCTLTLYNVDDANDFVTVITPYEQAEMLGKGGAPSNVDAIQRMGSTITYNRRYLYMTAYNIQESDGVDGNDTTPPKATPKAKTPPQAANATPDKPKPRQDGMLVIPTKKDIDAALFHNMPIEEVVAVFKMDNTQCDKYKQLLIEKTK